MSSDESHFKDVDNPGEKNKFSFRHAFKSFKKGEEKYKYHCLPTGSIPVSKDRNFKRTIDE